MSHWVSLSQRLLSCCQFDPSDPFSSLTGIHSLLCFARKSSASSNVAFGTLSITSGRLSWSGKRKDCWRNICFIDKKLFDKKNWHFYTKIRRTDCSEYITPSSTTYNKIQQQQWWGRQILKSLPQKKMLQAPRIARQRASIPGQRPSRSQSFT